ncbi:MAG: hypothetical protein JSU90_12640 [Nitrospiraceae bacterium]|nr:MAG: hypothetical protein JSU90_12640 [Nitrospiraceae bacterium]
MEYRIIIQENEGCSAPYVRALPLDPLQIDDALRVRESGGNCHCVFILEYCQN